MITRQLVLTVGEDHDIRVSSAEGALLPDGVSIKQGSDHILLTSRNEAVELRDALTEFLEYDR